MTFRDFTPLAKQVHTRTHTQNMLYKCLLAISFSGLVFGKNLKCHKAENFRLFCGFRRDVHIYADLCMIQPHPDGMEAFTELPELEECAGSAEDYECFLEMEYRLVGEIDELALNFRNYCFFLLNREPRGL